jgi:hypothetical protein
MSRTFEAMAETLFGDTTRPEQPSPPPPTRTAADEMAAKLYPTQAEKPTASPGGNPLIAEIRNDPARLLYANTDDFADVITPELFIDEDTDPELAEFCALEAKEISKDLGLSPADVREMVGRSRRLMADGAPSAAARKSEAAKLLHERFGDKADDALEGARRLLQRDPRAAQLVDLLGLGDDAQTVALLAEAARREATAGRLDLKRR